MRKREGGKVETGKTVGTGGTALSQNPVSL
jgi:hypothetical protein